MVELQDIQCQYLVLRQPNAAMTLLQLNPLILACDNQARAVKDGEATFVDTLGNAYRTWLMMTLMMTYHRHNLVAMLLPKMNLLPRRQPIWFVLHNLIPQHLVRPATCWIN
jgi:hypothetical protein